MSAPKEKAARPARVKAAKNNNVSPHLSYATTKTQHRDLTALLFGWLP